MKNIIILIFFIISINPIISQNNYTLKKNKVIYEHFGLCRKYSIGFERRFNLKKNQNGSVFIASGIQYSHIKLKYNSKNKLIPLKLKCGVNFKKLTFEMEAAHIIHLSSSALTHFPAEYYPDYQLYSKKNIFNFGVTYNFYKKFYVGGMIFPIKIDGENLFAYSWMKMDNVLIKDEERYIKIYGGIQAGILF
jgi:hypothetical protein